MLTVVTRERLQVPKLMLTARAQALRLVAPVVKVTALQVMARVPAQVLEPELARVPQGATMLPPTPLPVMALAPGPELEPVGPGLTTQMPTQRPILMVAQMPTLRVAVVARPM